MYYTAPKDDATLVSFNGFYSNAGIWTCQKDCNVETCQHIAAAQSINIHSQLLWAVNLAEGQDLTTNARELDLKRAGLRDKGKMAAIITVFTMLMLYSADLRSLQEVLDERSISHVWVGPPKWCRLHTDTILTVRMRKDLPEVLPLGVDPRCRCSDKPDPTVLIMTVPCTVYDVATTVTLSIQVQRCGMCHKEHHQFAGPDLGNLGLFNFNNSRVYTHALLNNYTSTYSTHPAAFHLYCTVVRRRYVSSACKIDFVGNDAFRTVWYSLSRIQDVFNTHACDVCGPNLDNVIFDATTSGSFAVDHITSKLRPPTHVSTTSTRRNTIVVDKPQTAAVTQKVGKVACKAIQWCIELTPAGSTRLVGIAEDDTKDDAADADADVDKATKQQAKRVTKRNAYDKAMRASLPGIA